MKILMVNHFPLEGSGSGVYTHNLASELSRLGHDVRVIYPEHKVTKYDGFESRVIIFNNGQNNHYDLSFNFPCFTSHPRSNETFYSLSDLQLKEYVDTFIEAVKVETESFKPDVIHAQHLWVAPFAAKMSGAPYVATVHGTDLKGFVKDDRYHIYALEGAQSAYKVITISKQVDLETKELYKISDDKRKIILNGYDESLFRVNGANRAKVLSEYGIDGNYENVVSFAGKLTHFKGVDVLLKAAKQYTRELDGNVCTIIAGNGELYDELNETAQKLGLDHVFFIGHLNQKQLVDIYNISDVNVVPSRSEPFGLVAIESLACGTPVVGTNQGGLPDFITPDVGTLVAVDDDLALSEAIVSELSRPDMENRREACAKYAAEGFSWKHSIDDVVEIYQEAISSK